MIEICVVGLGYIGLPTALMLASNGKTVVGVDINKDLTEKLNSGKLTFEEAGLLDLFEIAIKNGIRFQEDCVIAEIYIIAVPTPFNPDTKKIDPSYVVKAVEDVLEVCPRSSIIVIESTVSPGTIDKFIRPLLVQRGFDADGGIHIVHAPERVTPGKMITELKENSRTIGADCENIAIEVQNMYSCYCEGEIVLTDIRTAEITKVVENTFRDVNIAFANELAKICRQDSLDVYEIIRIANMHPRVNILQPGPGVGGHCISVDPWFLVGDYPQLSLLIHEARKINDSMPSFVLKRVRDIIKENNLPPNTQVGFYGITYKEDIYDVRESPTLQLYELMKNHLGGGARYYDPYYGETIIGGQMHDFDEFLEICDLIVVMVGHSQIKENAMKLEGKIVLDTRNACGLDGSYKL